jgi:acyl-coenzyme A synthetase/AMP-(fatty) acid ligase
MAGYKNLFSALNVRTVLAAGPPHPAIVNMLLDAHPLHLLRIPDVDELISLNYPHYAFDKRFDQAHDKPLLVLHTSGTTALPKPIIITHDWVASWCRSTQLEPPVGTESLDKLHQGNRMLVMMPPFHAGNLMPSLFDAVFNQTTIIFPLPHAVLTPDSFHEHFIGCVQHGRADIALLPSAYIHEIAKNSDMLDLAAKHLEYIFYTGGDVAELYGEAVSACVKLFNVNGATEMASFPALRPAGAWDRSTWKHIMPHPITGIDFRCHSWDGGDAKYAAVIVRNKDPEDVQPIFTVYPHLNEYHSGDLYSPHPTVPGLWAYRGRADDCFVLVTGSNINPLAMEEKVVVHPDVRAVLMLGQRRPKPGLLIEPAVERELKEEEMRALVEKLWPAIEEGNQNYYEAARVTKDTVLFTRPDKLMRRAAKGTVQRRPTLDMYTAEIDALYAGA